MSYIELNPSYNLPLASTFVYIIAVPLAQSVPRAHALVGDHGVLLTEGCKISRRYALPTAFMFEYSFRFTRFELIDSEGVAESVQVYQPEISRGSKTGR